MWIATGMLLVAGCVLGPSPTPSPEPSQGAVLRTFPIWRNVNGVEVGCDAVGVADPVRGTLEGNPTGSADPVWLRASDREALSIVGPRVSG